MQVRAPWRRWSHRVQHRLLSVAGLRTCRPETPDPAFEPKQPTLRSRVHDDAGAAAVELAFVLPVALLLLMGIIQFGALLFLQNTMVNVANDVARRVSVGDLTAAAGEALAAERLAGWKATFAVSVTEPTSSDVHVDISVPLADAAIINFGGFLDAGTLSAGRRCARSRRITMHRFHVFGVRGLLRDQGGNIATLFALMLTALFGFSALAVDGGNLYVMKSKLQRTADAAALAAASQLPDESDARAEALEYALKNMSVEEHGNTLVDSDIEFGYWHPGTRSFVSGGVPVNTAMVTTRRSAANNNPVGTYFAGLMGYHEVDIETTSVAGRVSAVCILALDPSGESAFFVENGTMIADGCAVRVNSDDAQALDVTSNGVMDTIETCVTGGTRILGSVTPPPTTGCPRVSDPLAGLVEPFVGGCDHTNLVLSAPNTFNLTEGVYCGGLEIKGQATVNLAPGLYIMKNGPFTVTGQANVSGNGVTIFLTGNDAVIDMGGNGTIDLSAPMTGDYAGILVFEDRDNPMLQSHSFRGGSNKSYSGVIYLPNGLAEYVGNGAGGGGTPYFIAWRFAMSGNGELNLTYDPASGIPVPEVMTQKLAILQ